MGEVVIATARIALGSGVLFQGRQAGTSTVRGIRMLDSMSGKRKPSRSGVEGIGGMAMNAGVRAPLTSGLEHSSSTLL